VQAQDASHGVMPEGAEKWPGQNEGASSRVMLAAEGGMMAVSDGG
jgi:hypothetical protein